MYSASKSILMPEWSPVSSVIIAWPYAGSDWDYCLDLAENTYSDILEALSQRIYVRVLLHPSVTILHWQKVISKHEVQHDNIELIHTIYYDDTWIRDYGPLSTSKEYINFTFDGWGKKYVAINDNQVNKKLALFLSGPWKRGDLVLEGGALEVNGSGILIANKDCVLDKKRNADLSESQIEQRLLSSLGLSEIIWLENINLTGDDTDGHIDTIVRFVNDETLIFSGRNNDHPDALILESLYQQVQKIADKKQWRVFELPTPIIKSRFDASILPATYANFLRCNESIFVPVYSEASDIEALAIFAKAFPKQDIIPIECSVLLEQHGSLHCATMQLHRE